MTMEDLLEAEGFSLEFPKAGEIRTGVITSITDNEVLVGIGAKSEGVIPKRDLERLSEEESAAIQIGNEISVYVVSVDNDGTAKLSYTRALEAKDWEEAERMRDNKETFHGTVAGVNKGGLVVRFGRLRGFIPASQVSRERRLSVGGGRPDKDLEAWKALIGQPIAVRVIEVDRERRRLILSERAAARESREVLKEQLLDTLQVGDVRTGRVTSLTNFGAFVNIDGADGLVHLSEISWERVGKASDVLKVGQEVTVKVIEVLAGVSSQSTHPVPAILSHAVHHAYQIKPAFLGQLREAQPDAASVIARRQPQVGDHDRLLNGGHVGGIVRGDQELACLGDGEAGQFLEPHVHPVGLDHELLHQ
jgi:small subunit ribosomal protein S1